MKTIKLKPTQLQNLISFQNRKAELLNQISMIESGISAVVQSIVEENNEDPLNSIMDLNLDQGIITVNKKLN